MKITKKLWGYIFILLLLTFTYIWCENTYLLVATILFLLAIIVSTALFIFGTKNLELTAEDGEDGLSLKTGSGLAKLTYAIETKNVFMNISQKKVESIWLSKQSRSLRFSGETKYCGAYEMNISQCYVSDVFAIFKKEIDDVEFLDKMVMPENAYSLKTGTLDAADELGEQIVNLKGDDRNEIFNLRDFVNGDMLKNVHWKLYAKAGEKLVKEGSLNIEEQVSVLYNVKEGATPEMKQQVATLLYAVARRMVERHMVFQGVYLNTVKNKKENEFKEAVDYRVATMEGCDSYMEYVLLHPINTVNHELYMKYQEVAGDLSTCHIVYVTDNVDGLEFERNRLVILVNEDGYEILEV